MKILLVTEFFPQNSQLKFTGGVEVRTYYLYKELSQQHQVTIISRSHKKISASILSLSNRFLYLLKVLVTGLRSNAQLVEASNFVTYLPAFIVGTIKGIPKIAWYPDVFIDSWVKRFGLVGWLGELAERLTLRLPWDHIIALSHQTKDKLINAGVTASKITVVYAGVNPTEFKISVKKFSHPTICCISRKVSYKRIEDLQAAFKIIQQTIPQANLLIFTGQTPRKELIQQLKASHVFCLPSIVEGFGLVTLEAIAAGIPFVNADIPINREITQNGKGGLLFRPKNSRDLAQKILKLLTDKTLYRAKILEGQLLLKNYSWEKSAQETEKVYQQVLK